MKIRSALPMPTIKAPAEMPTMTVAQRLLVNMRLIREYYHSQPTQGHAIGHTVMLELVASDVCTALELAIDGKTWQPPIL